MGDPVRRATPADAVELTRLREIMLMVMGPVPDREWWDPCVEAFRTRLADPDGLMQAFVIDAPDEPGVLASCSVGIALYRLPGPHNPSGMWGYVMNVATDPRYRRRGYARAVVQSTLDWFADNGIARVDLHASQDGAPLYRDLGFNEPHGLSMTRWFTRSAPAR